jgi:hypothetical protein
MSGPIDLKPIPVNFPGHFTFNKCLDYTSIALYTDLWNTKYARKGCLFYKKTKQNL